MKQETVEEAAERIYPTPNPYIMGIDQHDDKPLVVRNASGCELMKCKYYVDGKCTDPNDWVNENGDAVCGLREDAILVE